MGNNKEPAENQPKTYTEKKELLFVGAEYADNLSGIEVYLKDDCDHIGAIHYSKTSKKYSYHPDATKFMYYSTEMLTSITNMMNRATEKHDSAIYDEKIHDDLPGP